MKFFRRLAALSVVLVLLLLCCAPSGAYNPGDGSDGFINPDTGDFVYWEAATQEQLDVFFASQEDDAAVLLAAEDPFVSEDPDPDTSDDPPASTSDPDTPALDLDNSSEEVDLSLLGDIAGALAHYVSEGFDLSLIETIAGMVLGHTADPAQSLVKDLREDTVSEPTGMKALMISVFGEYQPVKTTSVVTQTRGNDTYQILIDEVAPGAAGVDYVWISGVALFGILLYCLMKLLGGVLNG